jgi:hypothetical protein
MNDLGDFSDLTDSAYEQERKKALAATAPLAVSVASTKSPDAAAKAMSLSRRYNVPPAVAEQFAEDYSARAKQEDAQNVMARAPKLGSWIAEQPERADLVHDDLDNLGGIEQTIGRLASYTMGARPDGGLPAAVGNTVDLFARGGLSATLGGLSGMTRAIFDVIGADKLATRQGALSKQYDEFRQEISEDLISQDTVLGRGVASGVVSAGQTTMMLPLAAGKGLMQGGEAVIKALSALSGGASYNKARDQGAGIPAALSLGVADTAAEYVGEKYAGLGGLFKDAAAGVGLFRMILRDIRREIPSEVGTTLAQNFNEWALINPDKPATEWIDEQGPAVAETIIATVVAAGGQSGAIRGIQKITGDAARRQALADAAEDHASNVEKLAALLAASKTAGRDATTLREFIAQVADEEGDAPTQFYVDGEQLLNVLNQSGMSRDEFAALAPTAAAQLDEALTGGMVRLPVGEFAAAGEKITAPLIDHLRASEDAPTRAEAREFMAGEGKALQEEVERELQKRGDDATFRDSVAGIQTRFEAELNAVGKFAPEVNKGYATLLSNFFGATAARLGMAPDELLAKYELRVQAKAADGRRVLNQVETDTPAFRKWFGLSKVVDAAGKPLVVYHGTRGDVTAFAPNKVKGRFPNSEGFYFASRPSHASAYADSIQNAAEDFNPASRFAVPVAEGANVIPAYVSLQNPKVIKVSEWGTLESAVDGDGGARVRAAREAGHDGVIVKREAGDEWDGMLVVAFRPEQIKSATGNRGTFDPADPNILNQSAQEDRKAKIIELRKRESILKSLQECMA